MALRDLTPEQAADELQNDPTLRLLDVRTEYEHDSHRLPDSTLLPVQDLATRIGELDASANWLVYCEHGRRSVFACQMLAQAGFENVANLRGGIENWIHAGLPFERGDRAVRS